MPLISVVVARFTTLTGVSISDGEQERINLINNNHIKIRLLTNTNSGFRKFPAQVMAIWCSSLIVLCVCHTSYFHPRASLQERKNFIHYYIFFIMKEFKDERYTHIKTIRDKGKIIVSL